MSFCREIIWLHNTKQKKNTSFEQIFWISIWTHCSIFVFRIYREIAKQSNWSWKQMTIKQWKRKKKTITLLCVSKKTMCPTFVASGLVQIPVSMYQTVVTSLTQGNRPVQVAMAPVATRIENTVTLDGQAVEVVTLEQWHLSSWKRVEGTEWPLLSFNCPTVFLGFFFFVFFLILYPRLQAVYIVNIFLKSIHVGYIIISVHSVYYVKILCLLVDFFFHYASSFLSLWCYVFSIYFLNLYFKPTMNQKAQEESHHHCVYLLITIFWNICVLSVLLHDTFMCSSQETLPVFPF